MNIPYTLEKLVVFLATSMDGKHVGSGKTEEEALENLETKLVNV